MEQKKKNELDDNLKKVKEELDYIEQSFPKEVTQLKQRITDAKK